MSMVYVQFTLDHPIFKETLDRVPDTEIQWVRNVTTDGRTEILVWVDTDSFDAFEAAAAADPTIEQLVTSIGVDGMYLCQVTLAEAGREADLYSILVESGSIVQEATVTAEGWQCHFGFSGNTALTEFFEACRTRDLGYDIHRIYEPSDGQALEEGLSVQQREALLTAQDIGYFEIPREASLERLGDSLGISDTAASERVRRGMKNLIDQSLADGDGTTK